MRVIKFERFYGSARISFIASHHQLLTQKIVVVAEAFMNEFMTVSNFTVIVHAHCTSQQDRFLA
jgi:hypothetical protein